MTITTAEEALVAEVAAALAREYDEPAEREHGVHVACQSSDFVIAACGYLLDWNEQRTDDHTDPACEACLAVERCPVCGARFKPGGWQ